MTLACVLLLTLATARSAAERKGTSATRPRESLRQNVGSRADFLEWKRRFDSLDSRLPKLDDKPLSNDEGQLAWGESYRMMAYVEMYEATGDVSYLDKFVKRADAVLDCRDERKGITDDIRSRVVPAWSSTKYSKGKRYCWIVHAGMITYPIARFVMVARAEPALGTSYLDKAFKYLKLIEETCAAFDEEWRNGPNAGEGYYFGRYLGKHLPAARVRGERNRPPRLRAPDRNSRCGSRTPGLRDGRRINSRPQLQTLQPGRHFKVDEAETVTQIPDVLTTGGNGVCIVSASYVPERSAVLGLTVGKMSSFSKAYGCQGAFSGE